MGPLKDPGFLTDAWIAKMTFWTIPESRDLVGTGTSPRFSGAIFGARCRWSCPLTSPLRHARF